MKYFHDRRDAVHPGHNRTLELVHSRFYWLNMAEDIAEHIGKCEQCTMNSGGRPRKGNRMQLFPSRYPGHMVAVDLAEFPHSRGGDKHLLTMIDRFSRYAVAVVLKNSRAKTVIQAITNNWIYRFGTPKYLLSDNGSQFTSKHFKVFVDSYSIKHKRTTPYHPQANGMIERLNRYIKQKAVIAAWDQGISMLAGDEWRQIIPPILYSYNTTHKRMLGYSPHEITYARKPVFPLDLRLNLANNRITCDGRIDEYRRQLAAHQQIMFDKANATQDEYDKRRKQRYDRSRKTTSFETGDLVTIYAGSGKKGKQRKFANRWKGIWKIEKRYGNNAIGIRELRSRQFKKVNVDKVKLIKWDIDQRI